ncbi:MAG: PD-(D/E)XK nuclease family protein [Vulcanimicrobiota bacterium]
MQLFGEEISSKLESKLFSGYKMDLLFGKMNRMIQEIKERDVLEPIYVVVPSGSARGFLRRKLGSICIELHNFKTLALKLARDVIYDREKSQVPYGGEEIAARNSIKGALGGNSVFEGYENSGGFRRVLMALLKDFRQGNISFFDDIPGFIEQMQEVSEIQLDRNKLTAVFNIFNQYRNQYACKFLDVEDIISLACQQAPRFRELFQTDKLFFYGFYNIDSAQKTLIEELSKNINTYFFLPFLPDNRSAEENRQFFKNLNFETEDLTGETRVKTNLDKIREQLFRVDVNRKDMEEFEDDSVQVLSCPTLADEAREIARKILASLKNGAKFEDMAVILEDPRKYGKLIREIFEKYNIPYCYKNNLPATDFLMGRSIRLLLDIPGKDFPRQEVMNFISSSSIDFQRFFPDKEVYPGNWDYITRKLKITKGQWIDRLEKYRQEKIKNLDKLINENDIETARQRIEDVEDLELFIRELYEDIQSIPQEASWAVFIRHLEKIIEKYLVEEEVYITIKNLFTGLKKLDNLSPLVDRDTVLSFVREMMGSSLVRDEKDRGTVSIYNFESCLGQEFDYIFIPGLESRSFPRQASENPLLLDFEKKIFNRIFSSDNKLKYGQELSNAFQLVFAMVAGGAKKELILTYPRFTDDAGTMLIPSTYLLEIGHIINNRQVSYEELLELSWVEVIPPRFDRLLSLEEALGETEYRQSYLLKNNKKGLKTLVSAYDEFEKALDSWCALQQPVFNRYSGKIESPALVSQLKDKIDRIFALASVSKLENYLECPYKFFAKRILNLIPIEKSEDLVVMSHAERGILYHNIYEEFYRRLQDQKSLPLTVNNKENYKKLISDIAVQNFTDFEETGLSGGFSSWYEAKKTVSGDVDEFVNREIKHNQEFVPTFFEYSFGEHKPDGETRPPASIKIKEGVELKYQGKIDRIDLSPDGKTCLIIDYKSGSSINYSEEKLLKGNVKLQLPLYLYSLNQLGDEFSDMELENSQARYYFITSKGKFANKVFSGKQLEEQKELILDIIEMVLEYSRNGIFIPYASKKKNNCSYCDYKLVCNSEISSIFEIKQADPSVSRLMEVKSE